MHHQQVDIVTFRSHHLHQVDGTEEHEAVETPDVAGEVAGIGIRIGYHQGQHGDDGNTLDEAGAYRLVAHRTLDLQFEVLTDLSEAVESRKLRDVSQLGLLLFRYLIMDQAHLQGAVDDEKDCEQDDEESESIPCEAMFPDEIEYLVEQFFRRLVGQQEERYDESAIDDGRQSPPE